MKKDEKAGIIVFAGGARFPAYITQLKLHPTHPRGKLPHDNHQKMPDNRKASHEYVETFFSLLL